MKKLISIAVAVVMMTVAMAAFGVQVSAEGDTFETAMPITLGKEYKNQEITREDPRDIFRFTLSSVGKVTLDVSAYYKYACCYLYDADGDEIWCTCTLWNESAGVMHGVWEVDLTKGTYYFAVIRERLWTDNAYYSGPYKFKISYKSSAESFAEPQGGDNNTMTTADKITLKKTYKGQLAQNDDIDYFKLSLKAKASITLKYTAYMEYSDFFIYDPNGNKVWESNGNTWNESSGKSTKNEKIDLNKGTYYLVVSQCGISSMKRTGNYTFSVNCNHSWKTTSTVKATLTANGKQNQKCAVCADTRTVTIKKVKSFKLSATTFDYNGKTKSPTVTVRDSSGKALKKGTDYTVTYSGGRVSPGEYKVTVKMKGNYSGSKVLTFKILPGKTSKVTLTTKKTNLNATWKAVKGASGYKVVLKSVKSGSTIKTITTTSAKATFKNLKNGTKYKVIVTAYKTIGGKKVYSKASNNASTAIAPATPSVTIKSDEAIATLKWKKISGASGYEVYRATSKGGTYKKIDTVTSVSYEDWDATEGKTYYYKVRAFTKVGSKKVYGEYSAVKKIKIVW